MIHGLDGSGHGRCAVQSSIEDMFCDEGLSTASGIQYTLREQIQYTRGSNMSLSEAIYPSEQSKNRILWIKNHSEVTKHSRRHIMQRKASAVWQGDLKTGKGAISTESGVLKQTQYSFSTRFENGVGTNPEELLAAAHAGCFTMALSAQLGGAGLTAQKLETTATVSLEKVGDGFSITKSHLDLVARIPGADKAKFDAAVKAAETGCPVSKLFKAEISVNARLES
jgi:lipoyl-dependent peroxiredoxin